MSDLRPQCALERTSAPLHRVIERHPPDTRCSGAQLRAMLAVAVRNTV